MRFAICAVPGVVAVAALPLTSHLLLQRGRDHGEHRLEEVPLMEQCPLLKSLPLAVSPPPADRRRGLEQLPNAAEELMGSCDTASHGAIG